MSGWATPNSLSPGTQCRVIILPSDLGLWEAINGALYALTEAHNWEEVGSISAEDAAKFFEAWWLEFHNSTYDCEGTLVEDVRIQNGHLEAKIAGEWVDKGAAAAIGQIGLYALDTLPENVLVCDGTSHLREDYPDLYAVLNSAFIVDADHFQVPDLRDRVPVGSGGTLGDVGDTGGEKTHTLTTNEMPSHNHTEMCGINTLLYTGPGSGPRKWLSGTDSTASSNLLTTANAGGGAAHNNLPPYQILVYGIIAQ